MSSLLTTTCTVCGSVEVPVERAVLRVGAEAGDSVCVMRCPDCGRRIERVANELMADALLLLGISVSSWAGPRPTEVSAPIDGAEVEQFRQIIGHEPDPLRWL